MMQASKTGLTATHGQLPPSAQGFSLVELLVAMGLGVLLMLGVVTVFDSSREGSRVQEAMASIQDSGRMALDFLNRDFRNADFAGCVNDKDNVRNLVVGSPVNFFTGGGVSGVASTSSMVIDSKDVLDGTSYVRIVGAQPACEGISALDSSASDEDDPLRFRSACSIEKGTVLLVSSCQAGDIFVKTNDAADATIQHTTAPVDGGLRNSTNLFQAIYREESQVLMPFVREYFVADNDRGSTSLYRRDNAITRELVPNVIDFQVVYGTDNTDDGSADLFTSDPADFNLVVSARVELTVRSAGEIDGNPVTRSYSSTSSIRNRLITSEAQASP